MAEGKAAVLTVVLNPEQLEEAIRSAALQPLQLSSAPLMSRLVRVMCPELCLDLVELGPAMLFSGSMARDCYTMILVTKCPTVGRSFNFEVEHVEGYMGLFPPGGRIDAYTPEGYANATLTIPEASFHLALERHFPDMPDELLCHGAGMKVSPEAMSVMTSILGSVEQALNGQECPLESLETRRKLQDQLLGAFLDGLKSGLVMDGVKYGSRTGGRVERLRLAREFVSVNAHRPFGLEEMCQAIGMSPRGVELLFRESLGISPGSFIRNQRLHGVRRVLLDSERKTGVVKEAAMKWGFTHMGHFGQNYRALFGETPKSTLERR
ncbi:helix-turn-helix domain-containing protein [Haloferula sp.]|uniref:helix-turn-helix domain-containing protein n=1 Tax=Haloferula sp. TaxID=2497595 RepID=UPI003C776C2F